MSLYVGVWLYFLTKYLGTYCIVYFTLEIVDTPPFNLGKWASSYCMMHIIGI